MRLDRSQELYIKMARYVEELAKSQNLNMRNLLSIVYEDSVYKTAYETQKLRGEFSTFREVAKRDIETAISKPWATDGKDFSTRIWENKAQLINTLQTEMTRSFMIGEGAAPLINRIQKRFNVSFSNARRLVETETAYVQEKGMLDTYEALDVEQYQILAVLDMKTSDICRHLDKKVFDKKDAKPGITAPPFHCYCRSTTTPYIDGITDGTGDTRAARDPVTGKTVFVESDLSYEEWYNKYVKNTDTGALIGLKTSNGITIAKLSKHQQERADIRNLDLDGIRDALINPLHIGEVVVKENGNSQRFIGETTTVNINPDTGVVITSWPTGKSRLKKYKKGK
ncbi:phage protein F-like protein [Megasphaera lornae]|uniref:Phage protein F-like protein n=2 Tax=Megasphaera lornae TaxID=1000568 RepID=A0ABN0CYX0_9FIRM|nr:phage protein F-like protein [Megasphaera lornae]